ncbi:conserved hypothetical protein [Nautilia profundicola AmH]|uniref:Zinc-dependent peptidase n=1 Tax=Nautilia profundicola (strain ATCC BAA-1463 / DSM 18972 / AmH) TaxID=598659 RepID=B9L8U8_NAUPA|nr:M90 family metallopeptidase [Nautilia profundicola]ACM93628.1 conserved hypothetical protein [Nautilia profundicola AmH]
MDKFKTLLIFLWALFFFFIIFLLIRHFLYLRWLKKLQSTPLDKTDIDVLNKMEVYNKLNEYEKKVIAFKIKRFKKEKEFIGIKINITNEIKTTIAFFACLPTIYNKYYCYDSLKYIYVYPYTIIYNHNNTANGIMTKEELLISGEAVGESVVIVWDEVKKEIHHNLGRNVIIHEFAHELDFENGIVDGIPPINKAFYKEWTKIMFNEYEKFKQKSILNRFLGKYSLIDSYAATNKAEFFAVMSEYYFMKPCLLKKHFPDIYKELKKFYKVQTDVC